LGHRVSSRQASRFTPDQLSVSREERKLRRRDSEGQEIVEDTQLVEDAVCVRKEVDPHAERCQFPDGLIDRHADADAMQRQRRDTSADASPDNDHAHPVVSSAWDRWRDGLETPESTCVTPLTNPWVGLALNLRHD
jgi:hypothetical protein